VVVVVVMVAEEEEGGPSSKLHGGKVRQASKIGHVGQA